jgi:hypothetical protein
MLESLTLQHFIYSIHPKDGNYDIIAYSAGVDKREWRGFCKPPPVDIDELEKLGSVFSLQKTSAEVVVSLFTLGLKDEWNRAGIYSHHIIIPQETFVQIGALPIAYKTHFIVDPTKEGDLPPITFSPQTPKITSDTEILAGIDSGTKKLIIETLLERKALTLICQQKDTEYMFKLTCALFQLIHPSARIIPFITAPLSRLFRREGGGKKFLLKLVQEHPSSLLETEQYIDIGESSSTSSISTPQSKLAGLLVDEFSSQGDNGVKNLHEVLEKKETGNTEDVSVMELGITRLEVRKDRISLDTIKEMLKGGGGEKERAKRYIRAMLDERKWKSVEELLEIFTLLVKDSSPKIVKQDIVRLINDTENLETTERLDIFEGIISSIPGLGDDLFTTVKEYYGGSLIMYIKDMVKYPEISSRMLKVDNYDSFETVSTAFLRGSATDESLFKGNLNYLMDKVRNQFAENSLDFIQFLVSKFPEQKHTIIKQLQIDDLVSTAVRARLSKDVKQIFITRAEKIFQLIKDILAT